MPTRNRSGQPGTPPSEAEIVRALVRAGQTVDPRTGSIIFPGTRSGNTDPFPDGFLSGIEERSDLVRRLGRLEPRERLLLFLWYVQGMSVTEVAKRLGISRVHCYRLRDHAMRTMTAPVASEDSVPANETRN